MLGFSPTIKHRIGAMCALGHHGYDKTSSNCDCSCHFEYELYGSTDREKLYNFIVEMSKADFETSVIRYDTIRILNMLHTIPKTQYNVDTIQDTVVNLVCADRVPPYRQIDHHSPEVFGANGILPPEKD